MCGIGTLKNSSSRQAPSWGKRDPIKLMGFLRIPRTAKGAHKHSTGCKRSTNRSKFLPKQIKITIYNTRI